jgi:hypothetical protein
VTVGYVPNCTAGGGTIEYPNSSIVIGVEATTDALATLIDDQTDLDNAVPFEIGAAAEATTAAPGDLADSFVQSNKRLVASRLRLRPGRDGTPSCTQLTSCVNT